MAYEREKNFSLTLTTQENGMFAVDLLEHESGDHKRIIGYFNGTGDHSAFDAAIGDEICSWISLMKDEEEEQ